MKLTVEQILEIAMKNRKTGNYGETDLAASIVAIARAVEAACQPRWLPMDSLPETGWVVVLYKSTEDYILDYRDDCDREEIRTDPTAKGWIPLPEEEECGVPEVLAHLLDVLFDSRNAKL
jgi:hypothetical protein